MLHAYRTGGGFMGVAYDANSNMYFTPDGNTTKFYPVKAVQVVHPITSLANATRIIDIAFLNKTGQTLTLTAVTARYSAAEGTGASFKVVSAASGTALTTTDGTSMATALDINSTAAENHAATLSSTAANLDVADGSAVAVLVNTATTIGSLAGCSVVLTFVPKTTAVTWPNVPA